MKLAVNIEKHCWKTSDFQRFAELGKHFTVYQGNSCRFDIFCDPLHLWGKVLAMWAPWGIKLDDNLCAWLDELRKVALAEMDDIDRIKELERLRLRNCGDLDEQRSDDDDAKS